MIWLLKLDTPKGLVTVSVSAQLIFFKRERERESVRESGWWSFLSISGKFPEEG